MTANIIKSSELAIGNILYVYNLHGHSPLVVAQISDLDEASVLAGVLRIEEGCWVKVEYLNDREDEVLHVPLDSHVVLWSSEHPSPISRPLGWRVRTIEPKTTDWVEEAIVARTSRWGQTGDIVHISDSHGLCYTLRFADGGTAAFCPSELEVITKHPSLIMGGPAQDRQRFGLVAVASIDIAIGDVLFHAKDRSPFGEAACAKTLDSVDTSVGLPLALGRVSSISGSGLQREVKLGNDRRFIFYRDDVVVITRGVELDDFTDIGRGLGDAYYLRELAKAYRQLNGEDSEANEDGSGNWSFREVCLGIKDLQVEIACRDREYKRIAKMNLELRSSRSDWRNIAKHMAKLAGRDLPIDAPSVESVSLASRPAIDIDIVERTIASVLEALPSPEDRAIMDRLNLKTAQFIGAEALAYELRSLWRKWTPKQEAESFTASPSAKSRILGRESEISAALTPLAEAIVARGFGPTEFSLYTNEDDLVATAVVDGIPNISERLKLWKELQAILSEQSCAFSLQVSVDIRKRVLLEDDQ